MIAQASGGLHFWPVITGVLVSIGGIAFVIAQFRKGQTTELRAALSSARDEIAVQRERGDRLEMSLVELRGELEGLKGIVDELRSENGRLSTILAEGDHLSPKVEEAVDRAMVRAMRSLTSELKKDRAETVAALVQAIEALHHRDIT